MSGQGHPRTGDTIPSQDANAFTDRFFAMEARLGLFEDDSAGYAWWDVVRYEVYRHVYAQVAGVPAHTAGPAPLLPRIANFARRALLKAGLHWRLLTQQHDVLVFRAPRQVRQGRPTDVALDDLIPLCPGRPLIIDTFPHYYHVPLRKRLRGAPHSLPVLPRLAEALFTEFGLRRDTASLQTLVDERLHAFETSVSAYRRLFALARPRIVLMVQNGIEKAMFRAAHEAAIPIVEMQHGLIGHAHPGYSYPRDARIPDRSTFPHVFLTFSDYWRSACHYPATHCETVGNDHFLPAALPSPARPGDVMVVSADIYHAVLQRWIRPVATLLPERRFLYKLHPNQQAMLEQIRADFADLENIEIVEGTVPATSLLARVSHVVLVQSTVFHEALQAGRAVCVIPELNYQIHRDLFGLEGVRVTPDANSLGAALASLPPATRQVAFFEPLDRSRARARITALMAASTGGRLGNGPPALPT